MAAPRLPPINCDLVGPVGGPFTTCASPTGRLHEQLLVHLERIGAVLSFSIEPSCSSRSTTRRAASSRASRPERPRLERPLAGRDLIRK